LNKFSSKDFRKKISGVVENGVYPRLIEDFVISPWFMMVIYIFEPSDTGWRRQASTL